jgi:hypothetical protein
MQPSAQAWELGLANTASTSITRHNPLRPRIGALPTVASVSDTMSYGRQRNPLNNQYHFSIRELAALADIIKTAGQK